MKKSKTILILGFVRPEPNSSAAGWRMMQLIDLFQQAGWQVIFGSPAAESNFSADLSSLGIETISIEVNHSSFDTKVKDINPNIVLFDRFIMEEQFGWRVSECCPNALKILDTEDLQLLRRGREAAYKLGLAESEVDIFSDIAKREIASILRCDISLIISKAEMKMLDEIFKIDSALLHYLPFLFSPINDKEIAELPSYESREGFVFVGNFLHAPNLETVKWLKKEIWPLIRNNLPQSNLHIYGAYPPQQILEMHKPTEGFHVFGRAENVVDLFQKARICLAPLPFGAGLKGKLFDAMRNGTPQITTQIGAEGIVELENYSGCIENDALLFANAAFDLYVNKVKWIKAQKRGFEIINHDFQKSDFEPKFIHKIESTLNHLIEHRKSNFYGGMIQQLQLNANKYMSLWIESKNKNQNAN